MCHGVHIQIDVHHVLPLSDTSISYLHPVSCAIEPSSSDHCINRLHLQLRTWSIRRNNELAAAFQRSMAPFCADQFVFVDETGKSGNDVRRRRGRAPKGFRPSKMFAPQGRRGARVNVVAAMTNERVLEPFVHAGTCNTDKFLQALTVMVSEVH